MAKKKLQQSAVPNFLLESMAAIIEAASVAGLTPVVAKLATNKKVFTKTKVAGMVAILKAIQEETNKTGTKIDDSVVNVFLTLLAGVKP